MGRADYRRVLVRTHLSKGFGFDREDRDANVRRITFVASEIVRHGGTCICGAVSPYRSTRDECRAMVGADRFIEMGFIQLGASSG